MFFLRIFENFHNIQDLTSEQIEEKQQKAEKKRREHLEKKKTKARRFVIKSENVEEQNDNEIIIENQSPSAPPLPEERSTEENNVVITKPEIETSVKITAMEDYKQNIVNEKESAWKDLSQPLAMSVSQIEAN